MTLRMKEYTSRTKVRPHSTPMPMRMETSAPSSGRPAASRPPKTMTSRTRATGRLTDSPRARSFWTTSPMESPMSSGDTA